MAPPARRIDLRLTISVHDPYPSVCAELVEKFAEYAGAAAGPAKELAKAVEGSIGSASSDGSVEIDLSSRDREVVAIVNAASARKLTCPLPD